MVDRDNEEISTENEYKFVVPLFDADMLHLIKAQQFYTDLGLR